MKFIPILFFIPLFTGCASAKNPITREMSIRPGEARFMEFTLPEKKNVKLFCKDKEITLQKSNLKGRAIVTESYFSDMKPFTCRLKQKDQILEEVFFKVEHKEYKAEHLNVDFKRIKLSAKDQKRADTEQVMLNKIYSISADQYLFSSPFKLPLTSYVTSYYGTRRVYNKKKKGQHLGTDFRAAIGVKVPSTNAGKVVFAGDLFYTGWTVIIDHGLDIYTVYGHLSKTLVEAGQNVAQGEIIGLSGNTGRSSGPHLHWGVKIHGDYVDGHNLVEESSKYFAE